MTRYLSSRGNVAGRLVASRLALYPTDFCQFGRSFDLSNKRDSRGNATKGSARDGASNCTFVSRPASTTWVSSKFSYLPFFLLPLVCDSRLQFHRRSNNSIRRILTAGTGPALLLAIMRSENHRKLLKSQETLYVLNGQKVWLPLDLRCRNFAFAITATRHGSSSALFPPFYLSSSEFSSSTWNRKLSRPPLSSFLPLASPRRSPLATPRLFVIVEGLAKQWHAREHRYLNNTMEPLRG